MRSHDALEPEIRQSQLRNQKSVATSACYVHVLYYRKHHKEAQHLIAPVHEMVGFCRQYVDHVSFTQGELAFLSDRRAVAGQHEHLMFPIMGMRGSRSSRLYLVEA